MRINIRQMLMLMVLVGLVSALVVAIAQRPVRDRPVSLVIFSRRKQDRHVFVCWECGRLRLVSRFSGEQIPKADRSSAVWICSIHAGI